MQQLLLEINVAEHFTETVVLRYSVKRPSGLQPATLLKKRLWYRRFPVNLAKFFKDTFF